MEILTVPKYDRNLVQQDRDYLYIFTDNTDRTSNILKENISPKSWYYKKYKTPTNCLSHGSFQNPTSAIIRGLENAFPVSTMKWFYKAHRVSVEKAKWTVVDYEIFKTVIDDEIQEIKAARSFFQGIKICHTKIGQGTIGKLPTLLQEYLDTKLLEIGIIQ
jgi:hypothetical protein